MTRELPGQTAFHWSVHRQRKNARRSKRFVRLFVLFSILYICVWFFVREQKFLVDELKISGNKVASNTSIESVVRGALVSPFWSLKPGTNKYLVPKKRVTEAIKSAFPEIAEVSINREGNSLNISLSERGRWGYWCREGEIEEECFALDRDGEIFVKEKAPEESIHLYGLVLGDPIRAHYGDQTIFSNIRTLVEELRKTGINPSRISFTENTNFRVALFEGPYLIIDATKDGTLSVRNLILALGNDGLMKIKNLEYADLRLDKKVFLKWLNAN